MREETKEMGIKKAKERRKQLRCELDLVKDGMNVLQMEMSSVIEKMDTHSQ